MKLARGTAALGRECDGRYHAVCGASMKIVLKTRAAVAPLRGNRPQDRERRSISFR
jgi:hypothetical protein